MRFLKILVIAVSSFCFVGASFAENKVTITEPSQGLGVGSRVVVEGTAEIADGSGLWVLVHPRLMSGQWWPQPRPVVDADGRWQAVVYIGQPQDIGLEFEIAVASFAPAAEAQILRYHERGARTGSWLPIAFPQTTSPIAMVRVIKESH